MSACCKLLEAESAGLGVSQFHLVGEAQIPQGPATRRYGIGTVAPGNGTGVVGFPQRNFQPFRQEATHGQSHLMNSVRVYHRQLFRNVDFEWQRQGFGRKGRVLQPVCQNVPKGICQELGEAHLPRGLIVGNALQEQFQRQTLTGFPTVDGIAVEAQQVPQGVIAVGVVDDHRGGEIAPREGTGRVDTFAKRNTVFCCRRDSTRLVP